MMQNLLPNFQYHACQLARDPATVVIKATSDYKIIISLS